MVVKEGFVEEVICELRLGKCGIYLKRKNGREGNSIYKDFI